MARGMSAKEAEAAAYRWTWRVDMGNVDVAIAKMEQQLTGLPLFVVGISNGAVVAVELARRAPVAALWIASGVPAEVAS